MDLNVTTNQMRVECADLRRQRDALTETINRLQGAIDALEGKSAVAANGLIQHQPVVDVIKVLIRTLFNNGKTFDYKSLAAQAPAGDELRIKRGVYSAISQLKKQGLIQLAPGGFITTDKFK